MSKRIRALALIPLFAIGLGACVSTADQAEPAVRPAAPTPQLSGAGIDDVIGADAERLVAMFGEPRLDIKEGAARKLQFANAACVLDAYLYPPGGGGALAVTYLDARSRAGQEIDRGQCIAALRTR